MHFIVDGLGVEQNENSQLAQCGHSCIETAPLVKVRGQPSPDADTSCPREPVGDRHSEMKHIRCNDGVKRPGKTRQLLRLNHVEATRPRLCFHFWADITTDKVESIRCADIEARTTSEVKYSLAR